MITNSNWRKPFFTIYAGQALSLLSSSAVQFSIIWWITITTDSAMALTIASVVGLLPQAIIGPFAGVWIDRFDRKKIIILSDGIIAVSSLFLAILFSLGIQSIEFVYFVLFIRALGDTFHKPAMQALIPQVVPSSDLTKAGGFGQMISSACSMIGPMLGAMIMTLMSLPYAMLIDVAGATIAIITLSLVKIPMLITTIIFVPLGTLLPLMVKVYFNGTPWHNGVVQTLFSSGMLIAAMVIGMTGGLKRQFLMISISSGLLGLCALIGGILTTQLFWVFCIAVFVMGSTGMGFNIPFTAYLQRSVPSENLGKVISLVTSVMSFAAPVGMFIAGPVSEIIGVSNWMISAGIVMIFIGFLSYFLTREFDMP